MIEIVIKGKGIFIEIIIRLFLINDIDLNYYNLIWIKFNIIKFGIWSISLMTWFNRKKKTNKLLIWNLSIKYEIFNEGKRIIKKIMIKVNI